MAIKHEETRGNHCNASRKRNNVDVFSANDINGESYSLLKANGKLTIFFLAGNECHRFYAAGPQVYAHHSSAIAGIQRPLIETSFPPAPLTRRKNTEAAITFFLETFSRSPSDIELPWASIKSDWPQKHWFPCCRPRTIAIVLVSSQQSCANRLCQ